MKRGALGVGREGDRQRVGDECRIGHALGVLRAFFDPKVLLLSLNYVGIVTASLGMLLFLPQIIKELGVTNMQVGWITMIPYIAGAISMVFCGWLSDRIGDRRWSLFTTCVISAVGLVIAGLTIGTWWSLAGITIGLAAALAGSRLIASLLYGVSARDPVVFAATTVLLLTVALVACWLPARRGARLSPLEALRAE